MDGGLAAEYKDVSALLQKLRDPGRSRRLCLVSGSVPQDCAGDEQSQTRTMSGFRHTTL